MRLSSVRPTRSPVPTPAHGSAPPPVPVPLPVPEPVPMPVPLPGPMPVPDRPVPDDPAAFPASPMTPWQPPMQIATSSAAANHGRDRHMNGLGRQPIEIFNLGTPRRRFAYRQKSSTALGMTVSDAVVLGPPEDRVVGAEPLGADRGVVDEERRADGRYEFRYSADLPFDVVARNRRFGDVVD